MRDCLLAFLVYSCYPCLPFSFPVAFAPSHPAAGLPKRGYVLVPAFVTEFAALCGPGGMGGRSVGVLGMSL